MLNRLLPTLLYGWLVSISYGQEPLSLSDAIQIGLQNNYQIKVSEKNLEIAQRNNNPGTAGFYPSLNLVAGQGNNFSDPDNPVNPFSSFKSRSISVDLGVELNWLLFKGFRVHMTKQKLELLEAQSEGNVAIVVENTIQAIILSYYRTLVEQEKVRVQKRVLELSGDRYEYEKVRKEIGASGTFEEVQFRTAYYSDSSNLLAQKIAYDAALIELKLLIAAGESKDYFLTDTLTPVIANYQIEDLRNEMLSNNNTLRNQYINLEIFQKEINISRADLYPTLSLNGGVSQGFNYFKRLEEIDGQFDIPESTTIRNRNYYANFSLAFNLFNGGNYLRNIKNAKVQSEIAQLNIEDAKNTLLNELMLNYERLLKEQSMVDVATLSLDAANTNMQLSEDRFKNGSISSLDYRNIQLQYLNAAVRQLEAIFSAKQTETELLRLTGGIIEEY